MVESTRTTESIDPAIALEEIIAQWDIDAVFNQPEVARQTGLQAVAVAAELGDRSRLAWSHLIVGGALSSLGRLAEAERHLLLAESLFRALGEPIGLGHTLLRMALVSSPANDYARTVRDLEEALAIARAEADTGLEALVLSDLAIAVSDLGDIVGSLPYYQATIELAQRIGDQTTVAYVCNNLGATLLDIGDHAGARSWLADSVAIAERADLDGFVIQPLRNLAQCHEADGDIDAAMALQERARSIAVSVGGPALEASCWEDVGRLRRLAGDEAGARAAYAEAAAVHSRIDAVASPAQAAIASWNARDTAEPIPDGLVERLVLSLLPPITDNTVCLQSKLHAVLSEAFELRGDAPGALTHLRRHHDLEHQRYRRETVGRSQRLAAQMNIERTRRELDAERTRSSALSDANTRLEIANSRTATLLDELQRQTMLLERQSIEDSLTGLFNRRHLDSELIREATRSGRFGRVLSIAMVDIDHFKAVNDRFSHQVGDRVLQAMAGLFTEGLRSTDVIARFGGEEFVFILPETSLSGAVTLVEQIRHAIEHADWSAIQPGLTVTVSAGIVSSRIDHSAPHLLASADAMLYLAKERGRNQIRWREINDALRPDLFRDEIATAPIRIPA